ncbi:hypothetical protein, partial [Rhodomicrobium sp.]|uniref:hypothetical protein n=1 Tax=Rhodomicrobium sp. TaxID=2720632 RepID=UPI0039E55E82
MTDCVRLAKSIRLSAVCLLFAALALDPGARVLAQNAPPSPAAPPSHASAHPGDERGSAPLLSAHAAAQTEAAP